MRQRKNELTAERGLELLERHWKWVVVAFWLLFCAWFILNRWNADPVLQPRRHRRQYAHDAGPRPASRPGLVRPSPSIGSRRIEHPLVAAGRPADRRIDPRSPAAARRRRGRALGGRDRAHAALFPAAVLGRADGPAAGRPRALSRSPSSLCSSPARPTACSCPSGSTITAGSWRLLALAISAIADRKRVRGGIVLGIATALSLAIGLEMLIYLALAAAATALFWIADRDERERLGAYAVTLGRRHRARIPRLRLGRQPARGLRRLVAGVAVGRACSAAHCCSGSRGCRPADWKRRLALAVGAGSDRRRIPRLDVAALPAAPRGRLARSRALVAEPRARGAADLSPRLADRDADPRPAGQRSDRLAAADLAQRGSTANSCGGPSPRRRPGFAATAAPVLADPHRPGGADACGPRRGRAGVDPGAVCLVVEIRGGARARALPWRS